MLFRIYFCMFLFSRKHSKMDFILYFREIIISNHSINVKGNNFRTLLKKFQLIRNCPNQIWFIWITLVLAKKKETRNETNYYLQLSMHIFVVDLTANMLHLIRHVFVDASKKAEHSIIISTPQIPLLLYSIGYATSLSGPV